MQLHPSLLVRDSLRYWTRKPWQALISVLLLALGSAAVATLWTLTDQIVRKPLPYPDSHELYGIQSVDERTGEVIDFMALADFRDFRERQTAFDGLFAYRGDFLNYRDPSGAMRQLFAARVTRDFGKTLRISPLVGRLFESEDFASEQSGVAIISYDLWQREFGGKAEAVGSSLWFDSEVYRVVGVMPKAYKEPAFADVWTPFPDVTGEYFLRDSRYWSVVGRLKPQVSVASARAEAKRIAADLAEEYPATNKGRGAEVERLQTLIVGDLETPLTLVLIAVSLALFATCLNLANLQLINGLQRRSELAIRQSVGESRHQAFARVLLESAALCLLGCGLGWLLSAAFIGNIDRILPELFLPRLHEVQLSSSLGLTILVIALLASASFGLLPALQATRADTQSLLKSGESRHGLSAKSRRSRSVLMAGQIAVAVLILHGALLVITEYQRLESKDLGFRPDSLVMVTLSPAESRMFDLPALSLYYEELAQWFAEQEGVVSATSASSPPLWGFDLESSFSLQGLDLLADRNQAVTANYNSVSADFLDTMGIEVVAGRGFNDWDNREAQRVALVNRAFVDEFLPDLDPLGQQVSVQPWMEPRFRQIVGVIDDYAQLNLSDRPKPQILVPAAQTPWIFTTFILRVRDTGESWRAQLQAKLSQRHPDVGVSITTMDELLESQLAIQSILYLVFVGFGVATLLLSFFGIGSQMAFNVTERRREWGIRLALGANLAQLNRLVVRAMLKPLTAGMLVGLALFALSLGISARFGGALNGSFAFSSGATLVAILIAGVATTWAISTIMTRAEPQEILKSPQ